MTIWISRDNLSERGVARLPDDHGDHVVDSCDRASAMGDAFVPCTSAGGEVKSNMGKRNWDFFVAPAGADR